MRVPKVSFQSTRRKIPVHVCEFPHAGLIGGRMVGLGINRLLSLVSIARRSVTADIRNGWFWRAKRSLRCRCLELVSSRWLDLVQASHERHQHWTAAWEQARIVAQSISGVAENPWDEFVPYFWSDMHGVRIQLLGTAAGADDVQIVHEDTEGKALVAELRKAGDLIGVVGPMPRQERCATERDWVRSGLRNDSAVWFTCSFFLEFSRGATRKRLPRLFREFDEAREAHSPGSRRWRDDQDTT
jgi:hypothetical protein